MYPPSHLTQPGPLDVSIFFVADTANHAVVVRGVDNGGLGLCALDRKDRNLRAI